MADKREGFFGTDNLHRAGWTIAIGIAGFVGALLYQKFYGPQKVVIESLPPTATSVRVTTEQSSTKEDIKELAKAIRSLAKASTANVDDKRLRELSEEVDRLRVQLAHSTKANSAPITPATSSPATSSEQRDRDRQDALRSVKSMKFSLPANVKGYTGAKLFGISDSTCPPEVATPGMTVTASFTLKDASLLSRATPLRVEILREDSPKNLFQIEDAWQDIQLGNNAISLSPKLPPGLYRLIYGFYLRDKLNVDFPDYYLRQCSFSVLFPTATRSNPSINTDAAR